MPRLRIVGDSDAGISAAVRAREFAPSVAVTLLLAAIEAIADTELALGRQISTGVTLHLLGTLPEHGKMDMVCIAGSLDEADAIHHDAVSALDAESAR